MVFLKKLIKHIKSKFCEHDFNGDYNISAMRQTVYMYCNKCDFKGEWSFEQWKKMTEDKPNQPES